MEHVEAAKKKKRPPYAGPSSEYRRRLVLLRPRQFDRASAEFSAPPKDRWQVSQWSKLPSLQATQELIGNA